VPEGFEAGVEVLGGGASGACEGVGGWTGSAGSGDRVVVVGGWGWDCD
jgi:hypothetical protein